MLLHCLQVACLSIHLCIDLSIYTSINLFHLHLPICVYVRTANFEVYQRGRTRAEQLSSSAKEEPEESVAKEPEESAKSAKEEPEESAKEEPAKKRRRERPAKKRRNQPDVKSLRLRQQVSQKRCPRAHPNVPSSRASHRQLPASQHVQ